MPHVSKIKIGDERLKEIFDSFTKTICRLNNKKSAKKFIQSLLSETEEVMLSKRLAAIYLFFDGKSEYYVAESLGISSSTAARIHKNARTGHYDYLVNFFENKNKSGEFGDTLYKILTLGLPPRTGKGRWKYINSVLDKKNKEK